MKIAKILTFLAAVGFAFAATAEEATTSDNNSLSYTLTPSVVSEYMFRGQHLSSTSLQPGLEADYGNFAFGVWNNTPFKSNERSSIEIDPYGSYSFKVNDSFSVTPGFTLYTYPNVSVNRVTFEPSLALSYTVLGVSLGPKAYYDTVLHIQTYEFNASYSVPMKLIDSELDLSASYGTYFNNVSSRNNYWVGGVTVPFNVSKNGKLNVGYSYSKGVDSRGWGVASYAYSF